MANILITGSNRGIGLEFVKQYLERGETVIATCRRPEEAEELDQLKQQNSERLHVLELDVSDKDSMEKCRESAGKLVDQLDILVNNAGCFAEGEEGLETVDFDQVDFVFRTNALGPLYMCKLFADLLEKATQGKVVSLTSGAGLLKEKEPEPGKQFSYGATKAALHKFIRQASADLRERGVICVGMAPGYVLTDMTRDGGNPPLDPPESVRGMIETTDKISMLDAGSFYSHAGQVCDWLQ
ncbi:MAG: SDR family oxidoreductase [Candidatus Sumerlaeota bacterium]